MMQDRPLTPDRAQDHSQNSPETPAPTLIETPARRPPDRPDRSRSKSAAVIAGLSTLALIIGGGSAWWKWHSDTATINPLTSNTIESPVSQAPTEANVQVYWLKDTGTRLELAASPIAVSETNEPNAVLQAALEQMLSGTNDPAVFSTIPPGTALRNVEVRDDGVHVNLSAEFTTGGGSASMMGRVAQVIYTATTLNPDAPVWIAVEGEPLDVLGGEGLVLDQPMTRSSFEENFDL